MAQRAEDMRTMAAVARSFNMSSMYARQMQEKWEKNVRISDNKMTMRLVENASTNQCITGLRRGVLLRIG